MPRGMNNLDKELDQLLTDFRYESSVGLGQKKLQRHHIDALKSTLIPFIQDVVRRSNWLHTKADSEVFRQEYHGEWQNP